MDRALSTRAGGYFATRGQRFTTGAEIDVCRPCARVAASWTGEWWKATFSDSGMLPPRDLTPDSTLLHYVNLFFRTELLSANPFADGRIILHLDVNDNPLIIR